MDISSCSDDGLSKSPLWRWEIRVREAGLRWRQGWKFCEGPLAESSLSCNCPLMIVDTTTAGFTAEKRYSAKHASFPKARLACSTRCLRLRREGRWEIASFKVCCCSYGARRTWFATTTNTQSDRSGKLKGGARCLKRPTKHSTAPRVSANYRHGSPRHSL